MSSSDVADEYASSLSDLVANSKPLINMLTMLAEENIDHAPAIVQAVEKHLQQVRSDIKLPVLYLIDSIVKNVGRAYTGLFTQNIVSTFCSVFEKVDEKTRAQMFKLRQTWNEVFPTKKLYAMDVRVNSIDPAWPITAPVPTSIHINPKFFPKQASAPVAVVSGVTQPPSSAVSTSAAAEDPQAIAEAKMREQLLKKQKKLLELQQKKLELELLQTKAKLEEQQKQLERQTDHLQVQQLLPALQNVSQEVASKLFGTPMLEIAGTPLAMKADLVPTPVMMPMQVPAVAAQVAVAAAPAAAATTMPAVRPSAPSSVPTQSPGKLKLENAPSKPRPGGKPGAVQAGPGSGTRSRDPRLATRQPGPAQPSIANVTTDKLRPLSPQPGPVQDSTNSVFETVNLIDSAKPQAKKITINIANKGNANKEPQGVSKKDPRLNSNKVHMSGTSKARSESSKSGGPFKGPTKSSRGPSPHPAPASPSRPAKPVPLPRKAHGKGTSAGSGKASHKPTSVIDLTDSPPHKAPVKKDEAGGRDKDNHLEALKSSSSGSTSSSSSCSSSPSKKDSHKTKTTIGGSRQSPSDKKKGSGKISESGLGGILSRRKSPIGSSRRLRERERDRERSANKKFDMFEAEADSPSPPPPPVISDSKKREDTTFKDVKVSKKGRNYVRRNRRDESRSPDTAVAASGDVDLRLGGPPEKHPRMSMFQAESSAPLEEETKKAIVDAATKDVDLRQLSRSPSKKRSSVERSEQPPNKKSKAEMIDVLFGNEDVDLRQLTPMTVVTQSNMPPSPPPPPIISQPSPTQPSNMCQENGTNSGSPKSTIEQDKEISKDGKPESSNEEKLRMKDSGECKKFRGWEKYKESKPDIYKSPFRTHKSEPTLSSPLRETYGSRERAVSHVHRHVGERMDCDGLGRPLLYHRIHENSTVGGLHLGRNAMSSPIGEDTDMRPHLLDAEALDDVDMNINIIVQQAEEQLKNGNMSFAQYNTLLKQVIHLNEMQKLREAKRRDLQENKETWERSRSRRVADMGKGSPRSEDENSRDSTSGMRFGDIDERFPVIKVRGGSVPSPPDPQWGDVGHHGRPGVWEQHPHPWARGSLGPPPMPPGPQFPRMMHGGPFHRPPGPGQDFPPAPNSFPPMGRWRPPQFRPPFDGDMENRFDQFSMRFPRGPCAQPPTPAGAQSAGPPQQQQPLPQPQPMGPLPPPTAQELAGGELPLADPLLLDAIAQDSMRTINIDGVPREIRFYGDTAVVMLAWDDPREIGFQGGSRRITFDERETIMCAFNEPYRDIVLDGCSHRVRLGAPTRELYVDGKWYECFFGGPPISVEMGGKLRLIKLEGPPPQVKIGMVKRSDLVAGKINLIINARNMVPIFLDAKPQRFDIEGKPHILKFTHALTNVQINGRTFNVEFGGLPKPIVARGKKHFIRFSVLPRGLQPGYVSIVSMEGGRIPSPTQPDGEASEGLGFSPADDSDEVKLRKVNEPALPMLGRARVRRFGPGHESPQDTEQSKNSPAVQLHTDNVQKRVRPASQLPLEMLTSLLPVAMAPSSGYSYQVEQEPQPEPQTRPAAEEGSTPAAAADAEAPAEPPAAPAQTGSTSTSTAGIPFLLPEINVDELFQKLVATGIVPTTSNTGDDNKKKREEDTDTIKHVDFNQPETLKVRQPALITALYSGIQCSSCGVRFAPEQTMKYSQHLDWHFRQNRRDRDNTRKAQSRKWYYDISDWIQFEEIEDLEERAQSWFETQQAAEGRTEEKEPVEVPSVSAGDSTEDTACDVCRDKFEQFYNEEREEWHLRSAIRVEGKTYHPLCYEDLKVNLEKSLEEPATSSDEKAEENDKEPKKGEETEEMESAESKEDDTNIALEKTDASLTADSTVDEPEGQEEGEDKEDGEASTTVKQEAKQEQESEDATENMQVAECDSTVVKTEDHEMDTEGPAEEELSVPLVAKVDTTYTEVACSIDGNVKFEDNPQSSTTGPISGKIKINITKPLPAPVREAQSEGDAESSAAEGEADDVDAVPASADVTAETKDVKPALKDKTLEPENLEPPPPGIEPVRLKPRLVGRKLTEMPPVNKGTELSGLCSIM